MGRDERVDLIRKIEAERDSKVIAHICGDRRGAPLAEISPEDIRPLYDHLRVLGNTSRIDLFLYSRGGAIEVPWRMVTMLREHCDHLSVLIPYRAHSAATLVALGCDEIVMGEKAELGPIDPQLKIGGTNETQPPEHVSVEDVISFSRFLKKVVGLKNQHAIAGNIRILTDKLSPWVLGTMYRTHTHIRMVASRMLNSHKNVLPKKDIKRIIKTLAQEIYSHGHAISRREAKEIGLPVVYPPNELASLLWPLLEEYEKVLHLREPLHHHSCFPVDSDETSIPIHVAIIESCFLTHAHGGNLRLQRVRKVPPTLTVPINLTLPHGVNSQPLPTTLQDLIAQLQSQIPALVQREIARQSPVSETRAIFDERQWRDITKTGI